MNKLFQCVPTPLPVEVDGHFQAGLPVRITQGGLVDGLPTLHFIIEGAAEVRIYCHELRQSLDILEPAPKKRERKSRAKPTSKAVAQLQKPVGQ